MEMEADLVADLEAEDLEAEVTVEEKVEGTVEVKVVEDLVEEGMEEEVTGAELKAQSIKRTPCFLRKISLMGICYLSCQVAWRQHKR